MTKKILSLVAGLLLSVSAVHAQQFNDAPKSEISISYGAMPLYYIGDSFANLFGSALASALLSPICKSGEIKNKENYGVLNIDYNYHVCPWLAIGINGNYSISSGDIKATELKTNANGNGSTIEIGQKIGKQTANYYTVMLNLKFDWFRREHISMYSRVAGGIMFAHTTDKRYKVGDTEETSISTNDKVFEGQISPFGIEAGGINLRGFAEVGMGQCGIAQIGCRYRF